MFIISPENQEVEGNRASFIHNQNEKGIPQETWMTLLKQGETYVFFVQGTQQVMAEDVFSEVAPMSFLVSLPETFWAVLFEENTCLSLSSLLS